MKTLLVPTDFSVTARNAALYALELAKQIGASKVVLYHSYQTPVSIDPIAPTLQMLDIDILQQTSEAALEHFRLQLEAFSTPSIALETINEFSMLTDGLNEACKKTGASLIVMGITGGGALEEIFFGSNTISIANHSVVPVIIVPAKASFTKIEEVVLACNVKEFETNLPVGPIKELLNATGARVFILDIDHNKDETNHPAENPLLEGLFAAYHPEYHYVEAPDFTEAIDDFAVSKQVDLIITIPKKQGWFDRLFKRSTTKMLAFHSHVPLMIVHGEGEEE